MRILRLTGIETGAPIAIDGDKFTTLSEYAYGDFCGSIICFGTSCVTVRETPEQILAQIGGEIQEAKTEHSHDWCSCPICGEPDMRRDIYPDPDCGFNSLIHCTNHACASNKATGYSAIGEKDRSNP